MIFKEIFMGIFIAFILLNCTSNSESASHYGGATKEDSSIANKAPRNIVIIFNSPVRNSFYKLKGGGIMSRGEHELQYIDDKYFTQVYTPDYDSKSDTLIINTKRKTVEVQHTYKGIERLSYQVEAGDTLAFTYVGNKPEAKVINRPIPYFDLNFEMLKREKIFKENFPSIYLYWSPTFVESNEDIQTIRKREYENAIKENLQEKNLLDSLLQNNLISSKAYKFFKLQNLYNLNSLKLSDKEIPQNINPSYDSLLYNSFVKDYVVRGVEGYYSTMIPRVKTSNSFNLDYKMLYDSIRENSLLNADIKRMLFARYINFIIQNSSIKDIKVYLSKFHTDYQDTSYENYLREKYKLDFSNSSQLALLTLDKKSVTFEELLKTNRGKVIYVDFWASWCGPCIKALPASKELSEKYKGENVSFIYLSIDEEFPRWTKGAEAHGINKINNSFIVEHKFTSKLLEELKVNSIPRYLIYDKKGVLVHKNAPGPGGEEVAKLLDGYLKE